MWGDGANPVAPERQEYQKKQSLWLNLSTHISLYEGMSDIM